MIGLQLHGVGVAAEDPNGVWESRILLLAGMVMGMDVGDDDGVEFVGLVLPRDKDM